MNEQYKRQAPPVSGHPQYVRRPGVGAQPHVLYRPQEARFESPLNVQARRFEPASALVARVSSPLNVQARSRSQPPQQPNNGPWEVPDVRNMSEADANRLLEREVEQRVMQRLSDVESNAGSVRSHRSDPASLASLSSGSGSGDSLSSGSDRAARLSANRLAAHDLEHESNAPNSHVEAITDLLHQSERRTALANDETARVQAQANEQDIRMKALEQRMVTGFNVVEKQFAQRQDDTEGANRVENWVGEAQLMEDLRVTHR